MRFALASEIRSNSRTSRTTRSISKVNVVKRWVNVGAATVCSQIECNDLHLTHHTIKPTAYTNHPPTPPKYSRMFFDLVWLRPFLAVGMWKWKFCYDWDTMLSSSWSRGASSSKSSVMHATRIGCTKEGVCWIVWKRAWAPPQSCEALRFGPSDEIGAGGGTSLCVMEYSRCHLMRRCLYLDFTSSCWLEYFGVHAKLLVFHGIYRGHSTCYTVPPCANLVERNWLGHHYRDLETHYETLYAK